MSSSEIIEPTVITPPISDDVGSCLVCDKLYIKQFNEDGILTSTQEFTWEEWLLFTYGINYSDESDGLCVGNYLGGLFDFTLNRQTLEVWKVGFETTGSVCSFQ